MFLNFTNELKKVLIRSKKEMNLLKHSYIGTEHFILSVLSSRNSISILLNEFGISYDMFKEKVISLIGYGEDNNSLFIYTPLMKKIINDAILISVDKKKEIDLNIIFLLIFEEGEGVFYRILNEMNIEINQLLERVENDQFSVNKNNNLMLLKMGVNLNERAKSNEIDPVIGRENEVSRLIEIISRRNKNNPLLIGEAGVGKTAIVEQFARRIVNKDVPLKLQNKKVISISMANLVSGTKYRGDFEEKVLNILNELENNNDLILFIDEIHTLVGAGGADGAIDASNILKPALARGNITIIGATTISEYRKYIEKDKALSRRFQTIIVEEPDSNTLFNILKETKKVYEEYHNVIIDDEIIKEIITVSKKYVPNRKEPDRSLDIMDEICSKAAIEEDKTSILSIKYQKKLDILRKEKEKYIKNNLYDKAIMIRKQEKNIEDIINKNDIKLMSKKRRIKIKKSLIYSVISSKYNVNILMPKDSKNVLSKLKSKLEKDVFGQNDVIDLLIDSSYKLFFNKESVPISFLFKGNKGVGKSFLARLYAKYLFNNNVITIDLSDYESEYSINSFLGSYYNEKKSIFDSLKEKPISLVLFENIDKAHISIRTLINNILKNGFLMDANKEKISFNNAVIILTERTKENNNLGFNEIKREEDSKYLSGVQKIFKFNNLDLMSIKKIIDKKIKENNKLFDNEIEIDKNEIIKNCDYTNCGASKIDNLIEKYTLRSKVFLS